MLTGFPWGESAVVGSAYREINTGMLLSLNAELIVSVWYPPDSLLFGFKDLAQQRQIRDLEARTVEQAGDALTYEQVIVCDHNTDGSHVCQRLHCAIGMVGVLETSA